MTTRACPTCRGAGITTGTELTGDASMACDTTALREAVRQMLLLASEGIVCPSLGAATLLFREIHGLAARALEEN